MRRSALCVIFLTLAGWLIAAVVVRSWAADPQPAAKADDDPFGDSGNVVPAKPKSTGSPPAPSSGNPFDETPPGLKPWPSGPAAATQTPKSVAHRPSNPPPPLDADRILTAEMAAAAEPIAPIDALDASESAAFAKIEAALDAKTEINCQETPLHDLVEQLKKRHHIEIQLDAGGLKDAGDDENTRVTKHLENVSLRAALRIVLDELQLKYAIHDEALLITSPQRAESDEFMLTRIYPVKDLVLVRNEKDEVQTDFQPLLDLIENMIVSKSWADNGGTGTITPYVVQDRCLLVISQTQEIHEEIVDLLATLRRFAGSDSKGGTEPRLPKLAHRGAPTYYNLSDPQAAVATPSPSTASSAALTKSSTAAPPVSPAPYPPRAALVRILTAEMAATPEPLSIADADLTAGEKKIRTALASPTVIEFVETPLKDVIDYLKDVHKIEIQLDLAGLKDAGVDENTPVTKSVKGISLRAGLHLMLDDFQLKYIIYDEVLLITSPQKADSEFMTTKIYPVKDLILVRNERGEIETDFDQLADLTEMTCPSFTCTTDGIDSCVPYQFGDHCLFVVRASDSGHESLVNLLAALRRCNAPDLKSGKALHLPQRVKAVRPNLDSVPASAPPAIQGGGLR